MIVNCFKVKRNRKNKEKKGAKCLKKVPNVQKCEMKFKTSSKYWENQSLAKPNGKKENAISKFSKWYSKDMSIKWKGTECSKDAKMFKIFKKKVVQNSKVWENQKFGKTQIMKTQNEIEIIQNDLQNKSVQKVENMKSLK